MPAKRGLESHNIDGIQRPTMPFVGQAEGKGVYGRYHSVASNLANLNHSTEIMQRYASAWVDYIPAIAIYDNV